MNLRHLVAVFGWLVLGCVANQASAAPIFSFDGIVGSYTIAATGGSGIVNVSLAVNGISQVDGSAVDAFIPVTFTNTPIQINGNQTVGWSITKTIGPGGDLPGTDGALDGQIVYNINLNDVVVAGNTMTLSGSELLASNTSSFPVGALVGNIVFTFNSAGATTIADVFAHANNPNAVGNLQVGGSASFSQAGIAPEPASMLLWFAGAFGFVACRRYRRARK